MSDEQGDGSHAPISRPASKRARTRRTSPARNEFDFIARVRQESLKRLDARGHHSSLVTHHSSLAPRHSSLVTGIGDDAAVIRNSRAGFDTIITADLLVEDIDFRLSTTTPRLLGHKALAVSLSDIAAMGARPRWALLSVGASPRVWNSRFLDEFYEGFFRLADAHGVALVGGDVSRTSRRHASPDDGPLIIDSIVLGEVKQGLAVLRSGARPGDGIYVTGALGGAAAGLRLLEAGKRLTRRAASDLNDASDLNEASAAVTAATKFSLPEARRRLMMRQLRPSPRVDDGRLLGERRLASAMIDLSDGLSSDLAHLCRESGVGALVDVARVPVDPYIVQALRVSPREALEFALDGGEDFELLFTARRRDAARLARQISRRAFTCIGEVTNEPGEIRIVVDGETRPLEAGGFKHF